MSITRREFFSPDDIFEVTSEKVNQILNAGEKIDYLTFVPDGEPTLDINLGKTIEKLKSLGIKITVISNSSLLWDKELQKDLMLADWVSVKVDAASENIWRKINRPHGVLKLQNILSGIEVFANTYRGILVTETMLVKGLNDDTDSLTRTANVIKDFNASRSYILTPTRPPAEVSVESPSEENINTAYQIYSSLLDNVELVIYNEGTDFSYSNDAEKELLSILAVHPMRREAVSEFLTKSESSWNLIDNLLKTNELKEVVYSGDIFLIRNIKR
jgi:wyosine [tRNA(Phe)-imidazoG37] synthetase (radical SAM superfamily)